MNLLSYPARLVDALTDRILAVVGAVGLSQVPGFITHYQQRLGGHLAEARRNIEGWQEVARNASCPSLQDLIARYAASDMVESVEAGRKCLADLTRMEHLATAEAALRDASVWERSLVFLRHVDVEIARGAAGSYTLNVPLDAESFVYAAVGILLALVLYRLILLLLGKGGKALVVRVQAGRDLGSEEPTVDGQRVRTRAAK